MKLPQFTAETALYPDRRDRIVPALLKETEGDPGLKFDLCMDKCQATGKTYLQCKLVCGGAEPTSPVGSGGWGKTQDCALAFWQCTLGCQASPFPGNFACLAGCYAARLHCSNPF